MDDATFGRLSEAQSGLLTRAQLRELGVTVEQLRWRLGRGWKLVLPHVVDVLKGTMTPHRQLVAASLEAGEAAVISGLRGALWHGLSSAPGHRPVLALVGPGQASRDAGFVRIRRTRRPDAAPWLSGVVRIASRARTVVDAARECRTQAEATGVVLEAVQRRLVTLEDVAHELEAGPRRGSALARQALRLAEAGAWSVPEADLISLCGRSKVLPPPWPNPGLSLMDGTPLVSPDAWFDDVGLAVMVHSRAHHARDADWEGTVESDGQLAEVGVVVLGFTPRSIGTAPDRVLQRIERAYLAAARSGRERPAVVMTPRGPGLGMVTSVGAAVRG